MRKIFLCRLNTISDNIKETTARKLARNMVKNFLLECIIYPTG